jgi:hypothetical protein
LTGSRLAQPTKKLATYAPRIIDAYSLDAVREIFHRPLVDGVDGVTALDIYECIEPNADAIFLHCAAQRLLDALPIAQGTSTNELDLAATIFSCTARGYDVCGRGSFLNGREALAHLCRTWPRDNTHRRPPERDLLKHDREQQVQLLCDWVAGAGGTSKIRMNTWAVGVAKHVVRLAGLDPGSATAQDMDNANAWFECTKASCMRCTRFFGPPPTEKLAMN